MKGEWIGLRSAKALKLHVLNKLPFWWMALVVSVVAYLVAGVIFAVITALASGERVR
jgi:Na+/H+ antiporter NhaC